MKYFASTYDLARQKFLGHAKGNGWTIHSYCLAKELVTDVAIFSPKKTVPKKAFILASGIHGVEGFYGSALQSLFIDSSIYQQNTDADLIFIHGVNPFGFSHLRRVNEDNVDVNRNFINFELPLPQNSHYANYDPYFVPEIWGSDEGLVLLKKLDALIAQRGFSQAQEDITGGQYSHPQGLFYGGQCPTWSHKTLNQITSRFVKNYQHIVYIDVHTGLGEYGQASLIFDVPKHKKGYEQASTWYGTTLSQTDEKALSSKLSGSSGNIIPHTEGLAIPLTLEIGTRPPTEMFRALLAEHWLFAKKIPQHLPQTNLIKSQLKEMFCPSRDDWQKSSLENGYKTIQIALQGLRAL